MSNLIAVRAQELIELFGGVRPAANALAISPSYLSRLASGKKTDPSDAMLKKLRLKKVVTHERIPLVAQPTELILRTKSA